MEEVKFRRKASKISRRSSECGDFSPSETSELESDFSPIVNPLLVLVIQYQHDLEIFCHKFFVLIHITYRYILSIRSPCAQWLFTLWS